MDKVAGVQAQVNDVTNIMKVLLLPLFCTPQRGFFLDSNDSPYMVSYLQFPFSCSCSGQRLKNA
jgi:hypothetical protein